MVQCIFSQGVCLLIELPLHMPKPNGDPKSLEVCHQVIQHLEFRPIDDGLLLRILETVLLPFSDMLADPLYEIL